jgi:hypothetical protein
MEKTYVGVTVCFLLFQTYQFLQEDGLAIATAQRLFWMLLGIIILIVILVLSVVKKMRHMNDLINNYEELHGQNQFLNNQIRSSRRKRSKRPISFSNRPVRRVCPDKYF